MTTQWIIEATDSAWTLSKFASMRRYLWQNPSVDMVEVPFAWGVAVLTRNNPTQILVLY